VGLKIIRSAQASWSGAVTDGGGHLALGSGAFEGPYTLSGRVEEGQHTANPEELIGLANAACYTMSLADLEQGETNWSITRIELHTTGVVQGVDAAAFEALAQQAKATCPVSRALAGTEIVLVAELANDQRESS
jgi:osmotically inducible protein OsmC